ncbi:MAG: rhodanese-like domain-containing protein [Planctomycetota bacterium]|jgi:rhodanese-related sulfurtransferase
MKQETKPDLPEAKQTVLGLYVTAKEAYEKWQADPEKVKILDVRTPEEYIFVGHAEMACLIPLVFQAYQWDAANGRFAIKPNPDFLALVKDQFSPEDTILITCRSGGRSAMAVNLLAQNGFKHAYNITDGMEGDMVKDPESPHKGKRMKNGWKNSGAPWTYEINPEKMRLPMDK